jgi:hypothetical protein
MTLVLIKEKKGENDTEMEKITSDIEYIGSNKSMRPKATVPPP